MSAWSSTPSTLPEPSASRAEWRARHLVAENTVVATMLAHFHHGKDHETLLRAWRLVVDGSAIGRCSSWPDDPQGRRTMAKALAYDLDLGSSVRFLEDVVDVAGLLAASDIGVLSSPSESAPNALLESMTAGLAVVGTDVPGIREIVPAEQDRYLTPPRDHEQLAAVLVELIGDPALASGSAARNREHVHARSSVPAPRAMASLIATELAHR